MTRSRPRAHVARSVLVALVALVPTVACGGSDSATTDGSAADAPADGVSLLSATDAAAMIADPPDDLVVLDVRTPEEFAEGHIEGAVLLDFYREDFGAELAALDPDVPYLVFCRSGNRSGRTAAMMADLGFEEITDVDGGVIAWNEAGLALTKG